MTDQNYEQDVDLDEATEVVDEAKAPTTKGKAPDPDHSETDGMTKTDPKAQAKKGAAGTSKAKNGDTSGQEPMQKLNAGYGYENKMENMTKLAALPADVINTLYQEAFGTDLDLDESDEELVEYNFDDDLEALVESEATLSDDFKGKASTIFEAAVNSKIMEKAADMELVTATLIAEKVEELEEQYTSEISEAVVEAREELVEKVDGYLNYVVETWMEENRLAVESGLRTEIAETFMGSLKDLFTESYIEVPESKVDLVDDLAEQVIALEEKLNQETSTIIEMRSEMQNLERHAIIAEASKDLAGTQADKLTKLAESIDFESSEAFAAKVDTLVESYFSDQPQVEVEASTPSQSITEANELDDGEEVVTSTRMDQYLTAIRSNN
jgi:molybdopterin-binding protein